MSLRLSTSLFLLAALPTAGLLAADPPTNAELEQRIADLDQQLRILARNSELAKEQAEADAAKAKSAVKDGDLQIKLKGYVQGRATLGASADTSAGAGQDYYAANNAGSDESETARLAFRRIRLSAELRSRNDWFGLLTLRADNIGTSGTTSANSTGNPAVTIYQAYIGKTFNAGGFEHDLKFGLDKIYNNDSTISSSAGLLALDRPLATLLSSQREIGVQYQFRAPFLRAGADIQDNSNLSRTVATGNPTSGNYSHRPVPATSLRVEIAPGADYLPTKKQESYVGAYGTQALLGFDWQDSGKSYAVANEARKLQLFGPDLLIHHDAITFLAEYRWSRFDRTQTAGAPFVANEADHLSGRHWNAQIGYAIPVDLGFVIEPALRYSRIDWSTANDERSAWGTNSARDNNVTTPTGLLGSTSALTNTGLDSGSTNLGSGNEIDVGLNLYWNGHANKTQLAYTSWTAESGEGRAHAFVVQHQVTF